jgi:non-ribosomal peptide synthetase component F
MTDASVAGDREAMRYPLSFTQEWFLSMDKGDHSGPFGDRYLIVVVLRVAGRVDLAVLQGALDDVVARHELLRTLVVRDGDPPYQMVLPPCRVPLEVRDVAPAGGRSRDKVIQELFVEAEAGTVSTREVPLVRALLARFDDRDSALFLTVHHSVSDGWSVGVILRDLGAFYAARAGGTGAALPPARQYREYVEWQRASAGAGDEGALGYWAAKLDGAREFVMPTDHGHPERYSSPYSMHLFSVDAGVMAGAAGLAAAARGSLFMVVLSAVYVLASQVTGATDLTLDAITSGRGELAFHDTMGLFLNVLPFRTDIGGCASFRDVVRGARETFIDAMANELPAGLLERAFPDYIRSREDTRMAQFLISDTSSPDGGTATFPIAEGARGIDASILADAETHDLPGGGTVWYLSMQPDGPLNGSVQFNRDEFEASTVQGWTTRLKRILASAVRDPDQDWRQL